MALQEQDVLCSCTLRPEKNCSVGTINLLCRNNYFLSGEVRSGMEAFINKKLFWLE